MCGRVNSNWPRRDGLKWPRPDVLQDDLVASEQWRRIAVHAIGGLTEVGFLSDGSRLLVASHQGRGEYDLATGERVGARCRRSRQSGASS